MRHYTSIPEEITVNKLDRPWVYKNSKAARSPLDTAIGADDLLAMGAGLHVLQDSFSHQGYGPGVGHAFDATGPDRPYASAQNLAQAMEMAELTYQRLGDIRNARHGCKCNTPWADIVEDVRRSLGKTEGDESDREAKWRSYLKSIMGWDPFFGHEGKKDVWYDAFTKAIAPIKPEWQPIK